LIDLKHTMKFTYAAVLAVGSIAGSDAFLAAVHSKASSGDAGFLIRTQQPLPSRTSTTIVSNMSTTSNDGFSEDFVEALKAKNKAKGGDDEDEEDSGSGSSRFKDLLKAAQAAGGGADEQRLFPRAIENPFLNPPPPIPTPQTPVFQPLAANPDELSVEEQARMFREMMAASQAGAGVVPPVVPAVVAAAAIPDAPQRVAKTDRAGRPVGRNRDADTIANTSDLYFAQLKRDSTVRTIARIRGEEEMAEQVFADDGIKQLNDLLVKNPYLKG
jgi:hypothetical protein